MELDTRYLSPHPRTVEWWEQRKLCEKCVNYVDVGATADGDGALGVRCMAVTRAELRKLPGYEEHPDLRKHKAPKKINHRGGSMRGKDWVYCIDARQIEGSPCGPEANLFKDKT